MEVDEEDGEKSDVRRAKVEAIVDCTESLSAEDIEEFRVADGQNERDEWLLPTVTLHRRDPIDHFAHVTDTEICLHCCVSSHGREATSNVDLQRKSGEDESDPSESREDIQLEGESDKDKTNLYKSFPKILTELCMGRRESVIGNEKEDRGHTTLHSSKRWTSFEIRFTSCPVEIPEDCRRFPLISKRQS
jgi:hypothetical protein